jgi:uncharacterized protein
MFNDVRKFKQASFFLQLLIWTIMSLAGCGGSKNIPPASILNRGEVTLTWEEVTGAKTYNVYFSKTPSVNVFNSYRISDATSPMTITDMEFNATYYFIITVEDDSGQIRKSKEMSYTVVSAEGSIQVVDILSHSEPSAAISDSKPTNKVSTPETQDVTLGWEDGRGVPQDYAEAMKWYRKAADKGNARAQFNLGFMYYDGKGVPQNYAEAMKWFRKAADQGHARAQFNLGFMYYDYKGVPQNYAEALKWYRKAADQGHARAQFNLGFMYYDGKGVPQNYAEAMKWFRKAADQGFAHAQNALGRMYFKGHSVPQNYAEALKWYRKAAEQGFAHAQVNLGYMYAKGEGVPTNFIKAYVWWSLASDNEYEMATENLQILRSQMAPQQIDRAKSEATILLKRINDSKK